MLATLATAPETAAVPAAARLALLYLANDLLHNCRTVKGLCVCGGGGLGPGRKQDGASLKEDGEKWRWSKLMTMTMT